MKKNLIHFSKPKIHKIKSIKDSFTVNFFTHNYLNLYFTRKFCFILTLNVI